MARAADVLKIVARAGPDGVRLTDLLPQLDLTRSTLHRIMQSLEAIEYLERVPGTRRYRLGLELFTLAVQAANPTGLLDLCRPGLLRLAAGTGDTVFLLVPQGYDAVCLDRIDGQFPIRALTEGIGGRIPLGLGSGPLILLAYMPREVQEEILSNNLSRLVGRTLSDEIELRAALVKAREEGAMVFPRGIMFPAIGNVAVPLVDRQGNAVAAISITGISERFSEQRIKVMLALLRREKAEIEERLNPMDVRLLNQQRSRAS
ncbi:IclR family transcriptional regulator [Chelatococcus asaccharovorans]|uniref:IclR family transcriptional regulator n=1 Tax=Chelatococcus asaccharovorans TaxID=28210 RepID=A0A2V3TTC7_9HYPH|nr:IclR family transcriptional regulator [Chelatococcus asaccharovorans]PXW50911.1 IclR family transcriptional regulator [Chelatococcus asaccharovorans]